MKPMKSNGQFHSHLSKCTIFKELKVSSAEVSGHYTRSSTALPVISVSLLHTAAQSLILLPNSLCPTLPLLTYLNVLLGQFSIILFLPLGYTSHKASKMFSVNLQKAFLKMSFFNCILNVLFYFI
jgi:hypothetical protein